MNFQTEITRQKQFSLTMPDNLDDVIAGVAHTIFCRANKKKRNHSYISPRNVVNLSVLENSRNIKTLS